MSAPLPEFWTQDMDSRGRTYYSNHRTRQTTWEVSERENDIIENSVLLYKMYQV